MEDSILTTAEGEDHELVKEPKMAKDLSDVAALKIPEAKAMAKSGKVADALALLLSFEKQTRVAADSMSNGSTLVAIVEICFESKDITSLQEHIELLSKRRGHLKSAITKMVEKACEYVDTFSDIDEKVKYIGVLREVTDGKIYVEVPRARLTLKLAYIKESKGETTEAASVLQELQVETFGSMEKKEKVMFILEQIRLSIYTKDYVRSQIISKKISTRMLEHKDYQQEKIKFYKLMVDLAKAENNTLEACKHYLALYNTECVKQDELLWKNVLRKAIGFLVLSEYNNEQHDLINRMLNESLSQGYFNNIKTSLPLYKEILDSFVRKEIIKWDIFSECFVTELKSKSWKEDNVVNDAADKPAKDLPKLTITYAQTVGGNSMDVDKLNPPKPAVVTPKGGSESERIETLKNRVIEHNIRVIASYYTRISSKRMTHLLGISADETEKFVSNMVVNKVIFAKIDRPAGIVVFTKDDNKDHNERLNDWSNSVNKLMALVENSSHLINLARTDAAIAKVRA